MDAPAWVVPHSHVIQSAAVDFSKPLNTSNLKGKTILITGGASGLGEGYFRAWAPHGATIIIGDLNESRGNALTESLRVATGNVHLHFIKLNVTDWQSQVSFFRDACKLSPHGGIDCVIANAGIAGSSENIFFEEPPDYTRQEIPPPPKLETLNVNLIGVVYTSHLAISYLERNPGSRKWTPEISSSPRDRHLILISSFAGIAAAAHLPLYAATKHALVGLFRTLRVTLPITTGIRINMLCPYFTVTPILGMDGTFVTAGAGVASVEGVVDAATRLVTDQSIMGRALAIGPKVNMSEARAVGFEVPEDDNSERAAWDVYAHDHEQTDVVIRRLVGLTNLRYMQRGWSGMLSDLSTLVTSSVKRLLGF